MDRTSAAGILLKDRILQAQNTSFRLVGGSGSDALLLLLYCESCACILCEREAKLALASVFAPRLVLCLLCFSQAVCCVLLCIPNVVVEIEVVVRGGMAACTLAEVLFFSDLSDEVVFHRHVCVVASLAVQCVSCLHRRNQSAFSGLPAVETAGVVAECVRHAAGTLRAGLVCNTLGSFLVGRAFVGHLLAPRTGRLAMQMARNVVCTRFAFAALVFRIASHDHRVPASLEADALKEDYRKVASIVSRLLPFRKRGRFEGRKKLI